MKGLKFCVDESVDFPVVSFLRNKGFDIKSISEECPSLEDNKILNMALKEEKDREIAGLRAQIQTIEARQHQNTKTSQPQ